jgi:hypothetical protein
VNKNIFFYIPEKFDIPLPEDINMYWNWQTSSNNISPYWGRYHWVLQTYLYFKQHGIECSLVHDLPERGIIITHRDCLDYGHQPTQYLFFVILQVDRTVYHPYGNYHVLHNPLQKTILNLPYIYIPPWPQVSLIPRKDERGLKFEKIGYFGYPENLTNELNSKSFFDNLSKLELILETPSPNNWNCFSDIDAIIAIRNFGKVSKHMNKPSLKMYNAWAAGVPAIMGYERSYRQEGKMNINYLEAVTLQDVYNCLLKLKENIGFRKKIVDNGLFEYKNKYHPSITINKWEEFIFKKIIPAYGLWSRSRLNRDAFLMAGKAREMILWRLLGSR